MGTLNEDQQTLMSKNRLFALRMRNISDKICREKQNTPFYRIISLTNFNAQFFIH